MINISEHRCVGCDLCLAACPNGAISMVGGLAVIDRTDCLACGTCIETCPQNAVRDIDQEFLLAVGADSRESLKLDDHFGNSKYFEIFKYTDGRLEHLEIRTNPKFEEDETQTHGDRQKANFVASILKDVSVIVGYRFGPNIQKLKNRFCCLVTRQELVGEAVELIPGWINEIVGELDKPEKDVLVIN